MPASSRPPEEQARVKPFDPLVLDRTVIAIPLLKAMQEDLEHIRLVTTAHPEARRDFNAAIEYAADFPGGAVAARQRVVEMLKDAAAQALAAMTRKLDALTGDARAAQEKRRAALDEAARALTVEPPLAIPGLPDARVSFARLHASIIRRLLAANDRLASVGEAAPIVRIHPTRFEVIIDLNLEHPGGREAARQWVLDHIEAAKLRAEVRDAGQEVHLEKDQPTVSTCSPGWRRASSRSWSSSTSSRRSGRRSSRRAMADNPSLKARIDAEPLPRDLPHLARLRGLGVHQQVDRHRQGGRRAELLLGARWRRSPGR